MHGFFNKTRRKVYFGRVYRLKVYSYNYPDIHCRFRSSFLNNEYSMHVIVKYYSYTRYTYSYLISPKIFALSSMLYLH